MGKKCQEICHSVGPFNCTEIQLHGIIQSKDAIKQKKQPPEKVTVFFYLHRTRNSKFKNQFPALFDKVFDVSVIW